MFRIKFAYYFQQPFLILYYCICLMQRLGIAITAAYDETLVVWAGHRRLYLKRLKDYKDES